MAGCSRPSSTSTVVLSRFARPSLTQFRWLTSTILSFTWCQISVRKESIVSLKMTKWSVISTWRTAMEKNVKSPSSPRCYLQRKRIKFSSFFEKNFTFQWIWSTRTTLKITFAYNSYHSKFCKIWKTRNTTSTRSNTLWCQLSMLS